jgi:hypothetical protein
LAIFAQKNREKPTQIEKKTKKSPNFTTVFRSVLLIANELNAICTENGAHIFYFTPFSGRPSLFPGSQLGCGWERRPTKLEDSGFDDSESRLAKRGN